MGEVGELIRYEGYPRVESGMLGHYLIGVHGWRRSNNSHNDSNNRGIGFVYGWVCSVGVGGLEST